MPRRHLLTYEEITRLVRAFATMGVRRVRLTGGEPTIRANIERLIAAIAGVPGIDEVAMTTNGIRFAERAELYAKAGLSKVNFSIDSIDPSSFREMTRGGDVRKVWRSIEAARRVGMQPIKINAVLMRGINEDQVDAMVDAFARWPDIHVRFIEYMPFGAVGAERHHVSGEEVLQRLRKRFTLHPLGRSESDGPAVQWELEETGQIVGVISPITQHFCEACNRLRLQADGHLRTCLSREAAPSLRDVLRSGVSDADLQRVLRQRLWGKPAGHEAHLEGGEFRPFDGAMTAIGG